MEMEKEREMDKDMVTLKINVEDAKESVATLTEVLERLTSAAKMATEALEKLAEQSHGGIEIAIVGPLAKCTVKPADARN